MSDLYKQAVNIEAGGVVKRIKNRYLALAVRY